MIEQKNLKREVIKHNAIKNVGCNLILYPATILTLALLIYAAWICLKYSFFGLRSGFIEPYEDKSYLAGLAVTVALIYAVLRAAWRNAMLLRRNITRYIIMRQEAARIEHIITNNTGHISDDDMLLYAQDENAAQQHQTKLKN